MLSVPIARLSWVALSEPEAYTYCLNEMILFILSTSFLPFVSYSRDTNAVSKLLLPTLFYCLALTSSIQLYI